MIRLLFAVAVLCLSGCNYERMKSLQTNTEPPKTWFASLQLNVLGPKCMGCHNPMKPSGGLDLSDYSTIMGSGKLIAGNAEGSQLFQSVQAKRMPKGPDKLNAQELGSLKAWIDAGASATAPNPEKPAPPVIIVDPVIPLAANFKSIKKNIIDLRCIGCHSGAKPGGELDMSTYKKLLRKLGTVTPEEPNDSTFYRLLTTDNEDMRMPKKAPKIPDVEINVIKAWILAGAKND